MKFHIFMKIPEISENSIHFGKFCENPEQPNPPGRRSGSKFRENPEQPNPPGRRSGSKLPLAQG